MKTPYSRFFSKNWPQMNYCKIFYYDICFFTTTSCIQLR
ncbi:hypothetical protein X975_23305, partial [Stegodyphus mimosarum]